MESTTLLLVKKMERLRCITLGFDIQEDRWQRQRRGHVHHKSVRLDPLDRNQVSVVNVLHI